LSRNRGQVGRALTRLNKKSFSLTNSYSFWSNGKRLILTISIGVVLMITIIYIFYVDNFSTYSFNLDSHNYDNIFIMFLIITVI